MPSTAEERAARREHRRAKREENSSRNNLAGYQTESVRLFGGSMLSSDDSSALGNSINSREGDIKNRRMSSQENYRNLSGIFEEADSLGRDTMQPPGQDAAQGSSPYHRVGPFKKRESEDYYSEDDNEESNNNVGLLSADDFAYDTAAAATVDNSGRSGSNTDNKGKRGVVSEREFQPARFDNSRSGRSGRSEEEGRDALDMDEPPPSRSRPRPFNMTGSTLTTSSSATHRMANTDDEDKNHYHSSRMNARDTRGDTAEDYGRPLYNDDEPNPFIDSDEQPRSYRPFSGGSQESSTEREHYSSMQDLLEDERSRRIVNHRTNRFVGCFDSLFAGKRTNRFKVTLLGIFLLLGTVIGICVYFVLRPGDKTGDINTQNMEQFPGREKPGSIVFPVTTDNSSSADSTFGMNYNSTDDVFQTECCPWTQPTFPDDSEDLFNSTNRSSASPSASTVPVSTSSVVPTPSSSETTPSEFPNESYQPLGPPSASPSVLTPSDMSAPPVTATPGSYPTNPPISVDVPSVLTDIRGVMTLSEPVPQDTETVLIVFIDSLKKTIRATVSPSLYTDEELVYVEIISINGETVDSLLLRRHFIRRRLQSGSSIVYDIVVLSDCVSMNCTDSDTVSNDVFSRVTNQMTSSVTSGDFASTLEVNTISDSGGSLDYVTGVEIGDFSDPIVTVLLPIQVVGANVTSDLTNYSNASCPPGTQQVVGLPECCVPDPADLGDGACDADAYYNTAACNYDGGDCCKETCNITSFYGCGAPQSVGYGPFGYYCENPDLDEYINSVECTVSNRSRVGDGRCDTGIEVYNTAACNWDGGDCCEETCDETHSYFECGVLEYPYDCRNPLYANATENGPYPLELCKFCEEGMDDPSLVVEDPSLQATILGLNCNQLKEVVANDVSESSTCVTVQQAEKFCCSGFSNSSGSTDGAFSMNSTFDGNGTISTNSTSENDLNDMNETETDITNDTVSDANANTTYANETSMSSLNETFVGTNTTFNVSDAMELDENSTQLLNDTSLSNYLPFNDTSNFTYDVNQTSVGVVDYGNWTDTIGTNLTFVFAGSNNTVNYEDNSTNGTVMDETNSSDIILDELSRPYTLFRELQGESAAAQYGFSVSLSSDGNIIAVGAKDMTDVVRGEPAGAVLLYSIETGELLQTLVGEYSNGEFGNSIELSNDGTRLVVGARSENDQAGVVRVYERDSFGQWKILGMPIKGTLIGEKAGWSVSISGDGSSVAVGAPKGGGSGSGAVVTYRSEDGSNWTPYGSVLEGVAGDAFGYATSLSFDGNIVAVGAPKTMNPEGASNAGKASVFYLNGSDWVTLSEKEVQGISADDIDGSSIALSSQDGTILVVGGKGRDVDGVSNVGHCRIYEYRSDWELLHTIEGQTENEQLGTSVAVSADGNVVACGGGNAMHDGVATGVVIVWNLVTSESSTVWPRNRHERSLFGSALSLKEDGKILAVGAPEWNSQTAERTGAVGLFEDLIT